MADSRPTPAPSYDDWLKLDRWLLRDAIFLLLDIDPRSEIAQGAWLVIEARGKGELGCFADTHPLKHIIRKVFEYNRLAWTRYQEGKLRIDEAQSSTPSVVPEHWACWARESQIPLSLSLDDFLKEVDQRSELFQVVPTASDVSRGICQRDSLLKMALGMAMDAYDYKPGALKNKATGTKQGSIAASLAQVGLGMDDATVRKILVEAETRFPGIIKKPPKPA